MKEMKKYTFALYALLLVINIIMMFFLTSESNGFKGHIIPWVTAIGMLPLGILLLIPTKKAKIDINKTIFFMTILMLNILMGVFSILDIVNVKHYALSSVMFIVAPVATILQYGIRHLSK